MKPRLLVTFAGPTIGFQDRATVFEIRHVKAPDEPSTPAQRDTLRAKDATARGLFTEDASDTGRATSACSQEKAHSVDLQRWPDQPYHQADQPIVTALRRGQPENGGALFRVRMVPCLLGATGQRFLFVKVMVGRFA
jgi:hypothetical protein